MVARDAGCRRSRRLFRADVSLDCHDFEILLDVLTFRSIATTSKFSWTTLTCTASGTLDRVDRATQFTGFSVSVSLEIPEGVKEDEAKRLLKRAEQVCLITNSLKASCHLDADVRVAQPLTL
jgi:uncharacterized OsmC-like protein